MTASGVETLDGAPCHTANSTMAKFGWKNIEACPWPSQSPDPIEHIWGQIR